MLCAWRTDGDHADNTRAAAAVELFGIQSVPRANGNTCAGTRLVRD